MGHFAPQRLAFAASFNRQKRQCIFTVLLFVLMVNPVQTPVHADVLTTLESLSAPDKKIEKPVENKKDAKKKKNKASSAQDATTGERSLNLRQVLEMAVEVNPTLQSAHADTQQAKAKYLTSLAHLIPDIKAQYSDTNYNGGFNFLGRVTNLDYRLTQPQLVFTFPVFQGGRKFLQTRAVKKLADAQAQNEVSIRQKTLTQVALLYYELMQRVSEVSIAEKQYQEVQAILDINEKRQQVGAGTQLDVLQSRAQFEHSKQDLVDALKRAHQAASLLNEQLSIPFMAITKPSPDDQGNKTLLSESLSPDDMLALALQHRPELKAMNAKIASLSVERMMVGTVLLPNVDLTLRTGAIGNNTDRMSSFDETGYGVTLNLPNLAVSAITMYKEKSAELKKWHAEKEKLVNQIERELMESYLDWQAATNKLDSAKAELEAANKALEFATERMKVGVGTNLDVLTAQKTATQARVNASNTALQYNEAQTKIISVLGLATVDALTQGIDTSSEQNSHKGN